MEFFKNRYYRLNRKLLTWIGAWSFQDQRDIWPRIAIMIFNALLGLLFLSAKFYTTKFSWDLFAEILPIITMGMIAVVKYIATFINADKIKSLWEYIEICWRSLKDQEDLTVLENQAEAGRLYILFYVLYYYSVIFIYISASFVPVLLDLIFPLEKPRHRVPVIRAEFFVDTQRYFYAIVFMCYILAGTTITVVMAIDAMFLIFVYHACGLFSVVGHNFRHLFDLKDGERNFVEANQIQKIKISVERHKTAIKFINELNNCFGWSKFLVITLGLMTLSVSLFCVTLFVGQWRQMLLSIMIVFSQIIYGYFYMFPMQKLIDHSSILLFKLYDSKWYMAPNRMQKMIVPIMCRTLTPSSIVVGKMFSYSFESYLTILQTAMSYFTTLYSFK